ncbi:GNAT family N-acetyltransferase [Pseudochryseolinea flava]|uniref:N-acetyltransferase n=1 Tax=Pseudochryseolinea flava TaxID=2059302 RepID=A0A364XXI2_9BACT|nr:GNAT family N-acetyltransferase [Pseudochryseolinea flava]RAV98947.1 N-acetyltransferase [Pseudochryseolinea flava]
MSTSPNLQPNTLEDNVTKLVPLRAADFDALYEVASDPGIWEQHPARDRYKKEVFEIFFQGAVSSQSAFLIYDRQSNALIGSTRYYGYNAAESSIGIGYTFLAKEFWGGPYNHSTKKMLLDYAFQFVDSVKFHIGVSNIRSQKAVEKLGATKSTEVDFELNGVNIPHFEYLLPKSTWEQNVKS